MRTLVLLASIVCLPHIVNAASPKPTAHHKGSDRMTPKQLVNFMVENADKADEPVQESERMLGFPDDLQTMSIRGDSTDPGEAGPNRESTCEVVLQKDQKTPECILIEIEQKDLQAKRLLAYEYRYSLNGDLDGVILTEGILNEEGHGVRGSGSNSKLDVHDPKVRKQAENELAFWLKRTAKVAAKKKAEEKKAAKKAE